MAAKIIREGKFSSIIRPALQKSYDCFRTETRIDDGLSDLLAIRKHDGVPCFLELKQVDHFNRSGQILIDLDPMQAIFLYERVKNNEHVGAAVMLRVGDHTIYTFPARSDPKWCHWIRNKLVPDELQYPLCFKHSISQLPAAMEAAYNARFTAPVQSLAA